LEIQWQLEELRGMPWMEAKALGAMDCSDNVERELGLDFWFNNSEQ
jgi:hypothetical protein